MKNQFANFKKSYLVAFFAPALISMPSVADQGARTLEEVVVTARKRQESLQTLPLSVSAMTGDNLRDSMISDLNDAQHGMPNVSFAVRLGSAVPTIRGVGFSILNNGTTSNVAMHANGVYIGRPMAVASSFFDVERLEVVRGPQGTLYGRNATGGAVNIITNQPTAETKGYVKGSWGNYNAVEMEAAVGGTIIKDKLLGRIAVRSDRHDGWGKNLFTGNDVDDQDLQAARASLRFLASEEWTIDWISEAYTQNDSMYGMKLGGRTNLNFDFAGVLLGGETFPIGSRDVNSERDILNKREFWSSDVTAQWSNGNWGFKSTSAFRKTEVNVESDIDGTNVRVFSGPNREENAQQYSQEFQLTYEEEKYNWLLGAYYFDESNDIHTAARDGYSLPNGSAPFYPRNGGESILMFENGATVDTTSYALFGEGSYNLTDALALTLGIRYTHEKVEISNEFSPTPSALRNCGILECDLDSDNVSPRIILKYTPSEDWMFYASVSDGFKSGGFSVGAKSPSFDEETIRSIEVGTKATLLDGRLKFSATAFDYDYDDLQVTKVLNASALTENAATASIQGVEAEFKALITDALQIDLSLGILDAEFDDFESQNPSFPGTPPQDLSGNQLPSAPELSVTLGAAYSWNLADAELTLRGEFIHSDEYYMTSFNERPDFQDSYELTNLFFTYKHDRGLSLGIYAKNVEDKLIKTSGYTTIVSLGTPSFTSYLPPRTYGLKIGYEF